jgi:hypothetical protein
MGERRVMAGHQHHRDQQPRRDEQRDRRGHDAPADHPHPRVSCFPDGDCVRLRHGRHDSVRP